MPTSESRNVPITNSRSGASADTTWRRSWTVGRSAQCRSSSTSTIGASAETRASRSTTAPNSRYRSDSASLDEARPAVARRARSGASRASSLAAGVDVRREHVVGCVSDEMGEHLGPRLIRDPEILVAASVQHDRAVLERLARERRPTSDVLPIPGSPETSTTCRSPAATAFNDRFRPSRSCARPTNTADDAAPTRPGSGIASSAAAADGASGASSAGSPASTAASSRRSSAPGSRPSSLDEHVARPLVGAHRVGLTARAVQRQHQRGPQPLAQRVPGHQRLQLADQHAVMSEHQVGVDPILDGREAQLVEPQRLRRGPPATATVGQRVAPPQSQRLAQLRRCAARRHRRRARRARPSHGARNRSRRSNRAERTARSPASRVAKTSAIPPPRAPCAPAPHSPATSSPRSRADRRPTGHPPRRRATPPRRPAAPAGPAPNAPWPRRSAPGRPAPPPPTDPASRPSQRAAYVLSSVP